MHTYYYVLPRDMHMHVHVHVHASTPGNTPDDADETLSKSIDGLDRLRVRIRRWRGATGHPGAPRVRGRPRALAMLAA